jgi:hypothetical protein
MNFKNLILGTLLGGVTNFLLGWIFYGMLLANVFPAGENMNLLLIFFGCLSFGLILTYIFIKWAGISTWGGGAAAGAILGTLLGLWSNFFMWSNEAAVNYGLLALDLGLGAVMGAITGAVIGFVLSKMK